MSAPKKTIGLTLFSIIAVLLAQHFFNFLPNINLFNFSLNTLPRTKTALTWNPVALNHNRLGQPESSDRMQSIIDELKRQQLWDGIDKIQAREATDEELSLFHDRAYIDTVKTWSQTQNLPFLFHEKWTPYNSAYSFQSAATAAGGLVQLSEAIARGEYTNGFALVRPPGHHAQKNHGMGYCIFNNIAIAASNLLKKDLVKKILIVDTDAHHGNGIEEAFQNNANVFYVSFHQKYLFPHTGETSSYNIRNNKLEVFESEASYKLKFKKVLDEVFLVHKPDIIIVSAGYDAHWRDFMSNLGLSLKGYAWLSQSLISYADQYTQGKIVFSLEGGYDLEALSHGVANTIKALQKKTDFTDPIGESPNR